MNSEKNDSEQALVIKLKLQTQLGSPQERTRIFDLEDSLQHAIEELGVGEFDGDEFGDAECSLYLYGSDANRLFEVAYPILRAFSPQRTSFVIKRFGPPGAPEQRISLDALQ
jgi:hypothetical protein